MVGIGVSGRSEEAKEANGEREQEAEGQSGGGAVVL